MMQSISHFQLFIHSLTNPQKLGVYRILSVGKVIQYTFILVLIMTAFSFGEFLIIGVDSINGYDEIQEYAENLQWLIYVISVALAFIINTMVLYAKISVYAFVALLFTKSMSKRAEYRQLWRTTTFAITWEILLGSSLKFFGFTSNWMTILYTVITITFIIIALRKYPKLKTK